MALSSGMRLGPYEITSPIGAGGMGEVYRAIDRRLNRAVAIKVVAERHRDRPDLHQRFKTEMAAIAALNHPHICQLYDVGEHEGAGYLVMELLEGETLAARLARGQLPLERALDVGSEIAAALDAAHRRGILHRDLKPANVMLTTAGVKLLDFGVARIRSLDHAAIAALSTVAAEGTPLTDVGTPLGTWQYMAPEQIRGEEVDARTDIFALGAVIYEMLAGRRAFAGGTPVQTTDAILNTEPPPISRTRTDTTVALDRVVRKCLDKDPEARWQHAGDLATELRWLTERTDSPPDASVGSRQPRGWLIALLSAAVAVAAAWTLTPSPAPVPTHRIHFTVEPPPGVELPPYGTVLALSPAGRHIAYVGIVDGETRLFLRDLGAYESRAIEGTTGADTPFFSPDGQWVGFRSRAGLQAVSIRGGAPFRLTHLPTDVGASWGPDDQIVIAETNRSALSIWARASGTSRPITTLNAPDGETSHRLPEWLPGGKAVVFAVGPPAVGPWSNANVVAQSLETGERHTVIRGAAQARFSSSGHLVYAHAGTLSAVPFDPDTLRVTGPALTLIDGVREDPSTGTAQFALSRDGTLAYVPGGVFSNELVWTDRQGQPAPLMPDTEQRFYYSPRLSPDAEQLAMIVAGGNNDLWLYSFRDEVPSRLTAGGNYLFPTWTPDGRRLTFVRSETSELLMQRADRTGAPDVLVAKNSAVPHSWSPDGRFLTLTDRGQSTGSDIWLLSVADGHRRLLVDSAFNELAPMISPDGRWLAYTSDESGRSEVYVMPFPESGRRVPISREGGTEPLWSKDGSELFYRQHQKMMAVVTKPDFRRPVELFEAPWWDRTGFNTLTNYDVAPGARRFILLRTAEITETPRIHVIVNWADGLRTQ